MTWKWENNQIKCQCSCYCSLMAPITPIYNRVKKHKKELGACDYWWRQSWNQFYGTQTGFHPTASARQHEHLRSCVQLCNHGAESASVCLCLNGATSSMISVLCEIKNPQTFLCARRVVVGQCSKHVSRWTWDSIYMVENSPVGWLYGHNVEVVQVVQGMEVGNNSGSW